MTNELLATLANLGAGALLASAALPVFARITALRFVHDPASSHRALVWALSLASALMLAPWLRGRFPRGAAAVPAGLLVRGAPLSAATSNASALGFYALSAVGAAWLVAAALAALLACISAVQLWLLIRRARPGPSMIGEVVARCAVRGARRIGTRRTGVNPARKAWEAVEDLRWEGWAEECSKSRAAWTTPTGPE